MRVNLLFKLVSLSAVSQLFSAHKHCWLLAKILNLFPPNLQYTAVYRLEENYTSAFKIKIFPRAFQFSPKTFAI